MLYDPRTFSVELGVVGDSPAYLLLSDGNRHVGIRLTRAGQRWEGEELKGVNAYTTPDVQPERMAYSLDASIPAHELVPMENNQGSFLLQPIIDEAVAYHGLSPATLKTSLLLASDGIEIYYPNGLAEGVYLALQESNPNIAQSLVKEAVLDATDNQTVIVIPDIQHGKGSAIAACVSDGMRKDGYIYAHVAAKTFETVVNCHRSLTQQRNASLTT